MNSSTSSISNGNASFVCVFFDWNEFIFFSIQELTKSSILSWTVHDVEQWLCSLNLSDFVDKFCKENGIDGLTLLLMKEDDLKQTPLAIKRLVDVKKLWYHIRLLQCQHEQYPTLFTDNHFNDIVDPTIKHNHSALSPTHLLESNKHNLFSSCSIHTSAKSLIYASKGEKRKLLVSFIYALISGIWTSFIMVVVHNRVPNVQK